MKAKGAFLLAIVFFLCSCQSQTAGGKRKTIRKTDRKEASSLNVRASGDKTSKNSWVKVQFETRFN